jgi:phage-related protein
MANNSLIFDLLLKDKDFQQSIKDAQKSTDKLKKAVDSIHEPVSKLGAGFTAMRGGVNGVFDSVFNLKNAIIGAVAAFGFGKVLEEASKGEKALTLLAAAMKRTGEFSTAAFVEMQTFSDVMLELKGVGGDTVISQLSLAKSFGLTNQQAKDVTSAAIDLSTAMGTDLDTAVRQLSEAYNGQVGKLAKLHPEISKLSEEQLAAGDATKILAAQFEGAAHALLNTYGGALSKTGSQFNDLIQVIGGVVTSSPAVVEFLQKIGELFKVVGDKIDQNKDGIQEFIKNLVTGIVNAGPSLIRALSYVAQAFQGINLAVTSATVYVSDLLIQLLSFDIVNGLVVKVHQGFLGIGAGALAAARAVATLTGASDETIQGLDDALAGIKIAFDEAPGAMADSIDEMKKSLAEARESALEFADKVDPKFENLRKQIEDVAASADRLKGSFGSLKSVDLTGGDSKKIDTGIVGLGKQDGKGRVNPEDLKPGIQNEAIPFLIASLDESIAEYARRFAEAGKGIAGAFASNVLGGKEGARKFVGQMGGAVADVFVPGIGAAVAPIVEALSQGPEFVKAQVEAFAEAIPGLIQAIADSIPVVIQTLADHAPEIIVALANGAPKIAYALAVALSNPQLYIQVASALAQAAFDAIAEKFQAFNEGITQFQDSVHNAGVIFSDYFKTEFPNAVKEAMGAISGQVKDAFGGIGDALADAGKQFLDALVAGAQRVVDALSGKTGKGGGGLISEAGSNIAGTLSGKKKLLATGGMVTGEGNRDTVPALLSPGELVIDRTTGPRLNQFMNEYGKGQTQSGDNGVTLALLGHVVELLKQPMAVQTTANVDGRAFADIILNLSRTNQRLRA